MIAAMHESLIVLFSPIASLASNAHTNPKTALDLREILKSYKMC